ncbi:unnamed protein product [Brassica oleracea var. botrytis]
MIPLITQTFQNLYHCRCYTYWIVKPGMEHLKSHFLNCCFFGWSWPPPPPHPHSDFSLPASYYQFTTPSNSVFQRCSRFPSCG